MAHDLLAEPLLSWRDAKRRRGKTTLPGVFARLASGELADFPGLRTHQLHPWCMFLTQLAAIALQRAGKYDPRVPEEEWNEFLLALTGGHHEPWMLVVEDLSKSAFFQPAVPERTIKGWSVCESPDDIDVLVTAKNHDVKAGLMRADDPEAWVYALTTLQTTQGYSGGAGGYRGVARMNGGYGNRPRVGLAGDHTLAARFLRDIQTLFEMWPVLIARGYRNDGVSLVWTEAWAGSTSLVMHELTPHFIEICRRIRCRMDTGHIRGFYTTGRVRRCLREQENGDVGDPWIPVERATGGVLTLGPRGIDYRLLTRLLFEADFEPAAAQKLLDSDSDPVLFLASALARGQGKTEGLHERALVLSGAVRRKLGRPDTRAALGKRSVGRVAAAGTMRSKVLYPALKQLALGGAVVRDDLDSRIDDMFFDHLFATVAETDDDARVAFDEAIRSLAWTELQRAIDRTGIADARRLRAISDAERMFKGCLRKSFPDVVAAEATPEGVPS